MRGSTLTVVMAACLAGPGAAFVDAAPITFLNSGISCNSAYGGFDCDQINDDVVAESNPPNPGYWIGGYGPTGLDTITIDLGGTYTLSQLDLYNTHNRGYNDFGTLDFRVWISDTPQTILPILGGAALSDTFGTLILDSTMIYYPIALPGTPNPVQSFTTFQNTPTGRYLTFRADSSLINGPGLSELDAFSANATVPEPATLGLMLCGLAGIARARRHVGPKSRSR